MRLLRRHAEKRVCLTMARIRSIKPDLFLDDGLSGVSLEAHFLLTGLPCLADSAGRLEDRPRRIQAQIFPYRPSVNVDACLDELARSGHIQRYTADGERYLQIEDWDKDQRPHVKEAPTCIPPPADSTEHRNGCELAGNSPGTRQDKSAGIWDLGSGILDSVSSAAAIASAMHEIATSGHPAQQPLLPEPGPPAKPVAKKPTTAAAEFAEWANGESRKMLAPDAPDNAKLRGDQWAKLGAAVKQQGIAKMQAAFRLYLQDPYWLSKGLPLGAFAADTEKWTAIVSAPKVVMPAAKPKSGGLDFYEVKRLGEEAKRREEEEARQREGRANGTSTGS